MQSIKLCTEAINTIFNIKVEGHYDTFLKWWIRKQESWMQHLINCKIINKRKSYMSFVQMTRILISTLSKPFHSYCPNVDSQSCISCNFRSENLKLHCKSNNLSCLIFSFCSSSHSPYNISIL